MPIHAMNIPWLQIVAATARIGNKKKMRVQYGSSSCIFFKNLCVFGKINLFNTRCFFITTNAINNNNNHT